MVVRDSTGGTFREVSKQERVQNKLKHLAGLEGKQKTGRQVTLGFSHTHTASQAGTQLGERRQEDSWTEWNPPA